MVNTTMALLIGLSFWLLLMAAAAAAEPPFLTQGKLRWIMYLTGQHNVVPEYPMETMLRGVTHVTLAFMRSDIFNDANRTEWPLFTTVDEVRPKFNNGTRVQVAIGGWGDTAGFEKGAKTEKSRKLFASNVKAMLEATGADGIDMDWEYPGGNGEDYKVNPNSSKVWEITAFPELLAAVRAAVGPLMTISAAVPGLERDMLAFTPATIPRIMESIDFLNVMTYDMMNRRDNVTKHHAGTQQSLAAIKAYRKRGVPADRLNVGTAFYVKWFKTANGKDCSAQATGCPTELMEDPKTGADLGKAGAFSWHDQVPSELSNSFDKALKHGVCDRESGGCTYWDADERLFWSWESKDTIYRKLRVVIGEMKLEGAFAWGLGEDAPEFEHLSGANHGISDEEISRSSKIDAMRNAARWRNEL
ncbi:chitinase [Parastagonospora nodorum]|uniref:chitinase n=1 Tax=Phaeosphaeria nodorum (strain SN15 / ATCC MYA-4574 / FGSC 10173) TaxID=321614 RepID=A0A7U2F8K6_PHANO|nr:chitinase [Parastagonospora nodorum]QRD00736.1 chitinase [Parastagonospora nodorum SN15]KAH3925916.1 chitinase [Parastagonospora nodorum]KAH3952898.1 chitinase [Parastagonospora nodorum]KAH3976338.1 chitinase [Parastagonospora nodorum]